MNIQSIDDARTNAGRPPGRSERTERNCPAMSLSERDAQESVDGGSCQDSDDGERSCKAEQADSLQRSRRGVQRLGICADVLRGNDGRHVVDGAVSGGSKPKSEANPDRRSCERESEDGVQYFGTADDEGTAKNGAR